MGQVGHVFVKGGGVVVIRVFTVKDEFVLLGLVGLNGNKCEGFGPKQLAEARLGSANHDFTPAEPLPHPP